MVNFSFGAVQTAIGDHDPPDKPQENVWKDFSPGFSENETNGVVETLMRVSFRNPPRGDGINVVKSHRDFLMKVFEVDPTLKVFRNDKDSPLDDIIANFPTSEDDYKNAFLVIQKEKLSNNAIVTSVIHKIQTANRLGEMKTNRSNGFLEYLKVNKIEVTADKHYGKTRTSAGMLLNIHPRLYDRQQLIDAIRDETSQIKITENLVQNIPEEELGKYFYLKDPDSDSEASGMSEDDDGFQLPKKRPSKARPNSKLEKIDTTRRVKIPHFSLIPKMEFNGHHRDLVAAEVLDFQCSAGDADTLKIFLSSAGREGLLPYEGKFFPRAIMNDMDKKKFKHVLRSQNEYLKGTTRVTIEGVKEAAFMKPIIQMDNGKMLTISEALQQNGVTAMLSTHEKATRGKYVLIMRRTAANRIRSLIDVEIKKLYDNGLVPATEEFRFDSIWTPKRTDAPRHDGSVISYAQEVLDTYNPQSGDPIGNKKRTYKYTPRKKLQEPKVIFGFDQSQLNELEFPPLKHREEGNHTGFSPAKKKSKADSDSPESPTIKPVKLFDNKRNEASGNVWNADTSTFTSGKPRNNANGNVRPSPAANPAIDMDELRQMVAKTTHQIMERQVNEQITQAISSTLHQVVAETNEKMNGIQHNLAVQQQEIKQMSSDTSESNRKIDEIQKEFEREKSERQQMAASVDELKRMLHSITMSIQTISSKGPGTGQTVASAPH